MKFNKFFMGVLGAMAFTACSSDEPINNPANTPDGEFGENFVTVSIEMPTSVGGRAANTNDKDNFDDGTENESKISNVVFFFFDKDGNQIEIQKIENPVFNVLPDEDKNDNPWITSIGTVEVKLNGDPKDYAKVAVALNSPANEATDLYAIQSIDDLNDWSRNYVATLNPRILKLESENTPEGNFGLGQVMSNSVYYETADHNATPSPQTKVTLVAIDEKTHVYTAAQKAQQNFTPNYIEIYVERVASRIDVAKAEFDMTTYYTYEENKEQKKTIPLYDFETGKTREIKVQPVITGMCLNVLTQSARLIKPINYNAVGYDQGSDVGSFKSFKWNDPINKRSYWATTAVVGQKEMTYRSWNYAANQGGTAFKQYVNPNTQHFKPTNVDGVYTNDGSSNNTKVMISAELYEIGEDGKPVGDPLDLVRYGGDYMLPNSLLVHTANLAKTAVNNINWASLTLDGNALTEAQVKDIQVVVSNGFEGLDGGDYMLDIQDNDNGTDAPDEHDWIAAIKKTATFDYTLVQSVTVEGITVSLSDEVYKLVQAQVEDAINGALIAANLPTTLYWKGGKTYYYHTIRHQGFYGLTGTSLAKNATDFLFGVVRNHIYNIKFTAIYGLGTPVIDPDKPINPDRPDSNPSFISARINILPWRVVTNNATIH